ncbi:ABC-2 type transport system permease protein [Neobacillus bataviensis]|uniref:ABC-2 type transport system permease protein n=1 Tax=Neobacillus bataviensis TaxID=220685 RepID=A0A561DP67_9BACI|nr:DUF6449 domain-containing protein [Neobacillus bataviensis]TWE05153.1 ABC-2 type transport system permease protein [Neobacillus bataviensis]
MPSRMSWFNKELLLQIGRSTGWISIVYFLGLVFILPIQLLMIFSDETQRYQPEPNNLFLINFTFQIGIMVIVPVILAVFLFRFLHVKQAADLMHSIPLKRDRIFHQYALTGVVLLILPVAVITLILLLMHNTLDFSNLFNVRDIFYWAGTTSVITLLLYTAAVFIAMMTGMSIVQAVLAYAFLIFPIGMTMLVFFNLKIVLYGFPGDYFLNRQLEKLSPISSAAVLDSRKFQWGEGIVYIILAIVLYGLSIIFYKRRNLESASEAIAFPKLRSIFKYGLTFCVMLLGGSYFQEVSYGSFSWTIFGYVIGAVLGYLGAEMILRKTWRVFGRIKGLIVYLTITAVLGIGVQILGIYENKVPVEEQIKTVLFSNQLGFYANDDIYREYYTPSPMKEKGNIEAVRKLHQQLLSYRKINQQKENYQSENFYIQYEMKNGSKMTREYSVNERLYEDFLKPIYESKEYKLSAKEIFKLKENKIKTLTIGSGPVSQGVTLSNANDIKEVMAALRKDVLAESYEDNRYFKGTNIEVYLGSDHFMSFEFKPNYQNLTEWLKRKELLKNAKPSSDDVTHVLVAKGGAENPEDIEKIKSDIENNKDTLEVTNKGQIEQMLNNASANPTHEYMAVFYFRTGNYYELMFFDEEHAPAFIKDYFK